VSTDTNVLLFGFGVSVLTAVLFGLLPALQFSRASVVGTLKKSFRQSRRGRIPLTPRNLFLIVEVALTVMLLIGTGLLLRSFALLKSVEPGFKADGLLAMIVPLPEAYYSRPRQQAEFARRLLERAQAIPLVESAAVSNSLPLQNMYMFGMHLQIEGRQLPDDTTATVRAISPDYFSVMRIPLLRGRDLSLADEGREDVAIINQEMSEQFWPGSDPVGTSIVLEKEKPRTIIGVVANIKSNTLDAGPEPEVYLPFAEKPARYVGLVLRSSADPQPLTANVRAVVRGIDPNQPITEVATMQEMIKEFYDRPRFNFTLFGSFAALALTLSLVGIYAVISHSVRRRTNEIGIRMALGARRRNVLFLFMRDGAFVAVAGIALGLLGAYATSRLLASMLFGIPPEDLVTFAAVSIVLMVVCLTATYFPARRAIKVDPMVALRHE
jgi:predicted permease